MGVSTRYSTPLKQYPDGNSQTLEVIPAGKLIIVRDYWIPDTEGFGAANAKWLPVGYTGFVDKDDLTPFVERKVIDEHYVNGQRTLVFNDNTCLEVPEINQFETYIVPNDGYKYKYAAHDWQRPDWGYKPRTRSECPETVPMWLKPDFFELREDYQNLWKQLIDWACHNTMTGGQLMTAWADITAERKALTDNHGLTHGFTDYILRIFLENNKPMMQKGLLLGGTVVRMRFGSTIFALDPAQPAPTLPWLLERPYLWGWATSINSEAVSFKWPNLKPFGGWGVPYLIIGPNGKNELKPEHLISLSPGQVHSPYARKSGVSGMYWDLRRLTHRILGREVKPVVN